MFTTLVGFKVQNPPDSDCTHHSQSAYELLRGEMALGIIASLKNLYDPESAVASYSIRFMAPSYSIGRMEMGDH